MSVKFRRPACVGMMFFIACPQAISATVTAGFSPGGSALALVLTTVGQSTRQLHVAAYSFTSKPVAEVILAEKQRGVRIRVMVDDKANREKYSAAMFLANQGVEVCTNGNYAIQHNKFMVADGDAVETGSFNYTASADSRNAENVMVLQGIPAISSRYELEFSRLWAESKPLIPGSSDTLITYSPSHPAVAHMRCLLPSGF